MMKKVTFLFIAFALLCGIASCSEKKENQSPRLQLVWEENFDGSTIDEAVWSKIPRGKSDWNNTMSDHDALYEVREGNLILRGISNTLLPDDPSPFLTGGVYTKGKKSFGEGRLEINARLKGATGAWPAFWMLPDNSPGWPKGGEIDIMERLNYDSVAYQTVHSNYTWKLGIDDPKHGTTAAIDPDGYNVYAVEKHRDSLVFFINGKHSLTYPRIETDKEGQFPFSEREFYLLLDMQLGGNWVGEVDPGTLPAEMYIDWVRFYRFEE